MFDKVPRYSQLALFAFGEHVVPPGIILEADRPEWAALKRESLSMGLGYEGGGIAASRIQLWNPTSSQSRMVFERAQGYSATPLLQCVIEDAALANLATAGGTARDTRLRGQGEVRHVSIGLPGLAYDMARMIAVDGVPNHWFIYDTPIILSPGEGLTFVGDIGAAMLIGIAWRERVLRPEERKP